MTLISIFLWALLAFTLLLNIIASIIILKAFFIVEARRYAQLALAWLLPIIGSLLIIYLYKEELFRRDNGKIGNNTTISNNQAITHAQAFRQNNR